MEKEPHTVLSKTWSWFQRSTRDMRVADEAENLAGEFLTGGLFKTFLRIVLDVALLWLLLVGVACLMDMLVPSSACVTQCFSARSNACCPVNWAVSLRIAIFLLSVVLAGYLSTRCKQTGKLAHSAGVNVIFLLTLVAYLIFTPMPGWIIAALFFLAYFAFFTGYRLYFR